MITWRLYYADGSTFDNTKGQPENAPPIGVICVKYLSKQSDWVLDHYKDYYCWNLDQQEWWGADASGFWQYMFTPGFKVVKFGTTIPNDLFYKRMAEAREDTSGGMKRIT